MSKVLKLDSAYDAKETLEQAVEKYKDAKAVIILVLKEDGTQAMLTSNMNQYEKCFLKCFFDAWIAHWFQLDGE